MREDWARICSNNFFYETQSCHWECETNETIMTIHEISKNQTVILVYIYIIMHCRTSKNRKQNFLDELPPRRCAGSQLTLLCQGYARVHSTFYRERSSIGAQQVQTFLNLFDRASSGDWWNLDMANALTLKLTSRWPIKDLAAHSAAWRLLDVTQPGQERPWFDKTWRQTIWPY